MWKVAVVAWLACSTPKKPDRDTPATPVETAPPVAPAPPPPDPEPPDLGPPTNADLESPKRETKGQAAIAWQKNEDGIAAMKASKYADATAHFRDAVARIPDAPYFFNLCLSLYWEGKFGEALTACNAVEKSEPTDALRAKTSTMAARIENEAARQNLKVD